MNPLLAEPTIEQRLLLETVYRGRGLANTASKRRWPIFQYVEQELAREGLDAMKLISDCPIVGDFGGKYGWTWCATHQAADEIGLTVAGMAHLPAAHREVDLFLAALAVLVAEQRSFKPSPTEVVAVEISADELCASLPPTWRLDAASLMGLREAMGHEPATWHCRASGSPDDAWVLTLSPFLRRFGDLATSNIYLERVLEVMAPMVPVPEPLYRSPLSLPEAIDYLNAIWRLHAGAPLLRIGRAEAAAKLVLDCATADEFDSRLSALCGILDAIHLPGCDGSKLTDLDAYLMRELGEESTGRSSDAILDLRALFGVRAWRQHPGTEQRAAAGLVRLGISSPVVDWGIAWHRVQERTVAALSALREEIETLTAT